jgi:hypothetical protein
MDTNNSKLVLDLLMNIPTITTTNLSTVDQWFSPGTLVSSINKIDRHNITEILFKEALNTITLTLTQSVQQFLWRRS